jgi:Fe-S oxidoreductase
MGEMELTPNPDEQMSCFACMACDEICPVGIQPAELALSMRHVQEQIRPALWKQPLFGGLVSHVERMELATLPLRLYQRLGIRSLAYKLRLTRLLPHQLRDMEAMLPHHSARFSTGCRDHCWGKPATGWAFPGCAQRAVRGRERPRRVLAQCCAL